MTQQQIRRERWPSRFSYLVAFASSLIGLGNFLRFPGTAAKYEGITFLIPYFIITWIVGYVMVTLETACGEMYRSGILTFFDRVDKRFRGFGILQGITTLISISYLNVILGWLFIYMVRSNYTPWEANPTEYFQAYILNQVEFKFAVYFITLLASFVVWTLLFISIYKGVTHTTKIVYLTLPLSVLMMVLLLVRSVTLPNSGRILLNTILIVDLPMLLRARIWLDALGQVLFSLCIGIGTSSVYGSYRIKDGLLMKDTFIVVLLNLVIEILGWIIVVCIAGHEGWSREDVANNKFSLGFILYPQILAKLPYPNSWSFLYYLFMFTAGINCSHASLESIVTTLLDSQRFCDYSRIRITFYVVVSGALLSVFFCSFTELIEPFDHFNSNMLLVLASLGECITATYYYNKKMVCNELGDNPVNIAYTSWLLAPIIGAFIFFVTNSYYLRFVVGTSIFIIGTIAAIYTSPDTIKFKKTLYILFKYQGEIFIHHFNDSLRMSERSRLFKLSLFWFNCIKYASTPLLITLLTVCLFRIPELSMEFQIVGTGLAVLGFGIVLVPWYLSNMFESFVPDDKIVVEEQNQLHMDEWLRYWFLKEGKILHRKI